MKPLVVISIAVGHKRGNLHVFVGGLVKVIYGEGVYN